MLPRRVEPAFGGALLALLRDEAHRVRHDVQRDADHLVGCRHFKVQRHADGIPQRLHVGITDMAAILAQVCRDAVRTGLDGQQGRADRVRTRTSPRVAHGRHVVDVDAETQVAAHGIRP